MSSSDSYIIDVFNACIVFLNRYIGTILWILGNFGNIFSILVFARKSWRNNVSVLYATACLTANLCYIDSTVLIAILSFGFNVTITQSNVFLCKIFYYVSYVSSLLLPVFLVAASIDRLLISSQNIDTRLYSSKRLAYFSLSTFTCCVLIFYCDLLVKVDLQIIGPSYFLCYFDLTPAYLQYRIYSQFILTLLFTITMIILCILTFKNVRRIRAVPQGHQRRHIRTMTKKDFQLLRCLYVHDVVYVAFSIEIAIFYIYQATTQNKTLTSFETQINTNIEYLCIFISHIPRFSSFYIFISISKAFRNDVKHMILKLLCKDTARIAIENNELEIAVVSRHVS